MRRGSVDRRVAASVTGAALSAASGCGASGDFGHWAIIALKVFAGLVVAVVVFLPLMASLATIRAAVRRVLGSKDRSGP